MRKIIRRGKIPKDPVHEVACKHCNTLFEFAESDATKVFVYDRTELRIVCPLCERVASLVVGT